MKSLSEMTLKELWELFPIQLSVHRGCWAEWYNEEKGFIESFLPEPFVINHIGSTAVNNICAKPIIDILLEAPAGSHGYIKNLLVHNGYICMAEDGERIDFNKGYTPAGFAERVFHLHLRAYGDNRELYFRDYLIDFPDIALEYEQLKKSLLGTYEHDRDGYTDAKTDFVTRHTLAAIEYYGSRR